MPKWSDKPPTAGDGITFRIVRTPAAKPLTAISTAPQVTGCCTHFVQNRTVPCEGEDYCDWCKQGHSWRWHGYLSAILTQTYEHILFEFTATASDVFRNYLRLHGSLRGCRFTAHRPSGRHNGRVVIACTPADEQRIRLPDPPDIARILCHIWNVQYQGVDQVRIPNRLGHQIGVPPSDGDGRNRPKTTRT